MNTNGRSKEKLFSFVRDQEHILGKGDWSTFFRREHNEIWFFSAVVSGPWKMVHQVSASKGTYKYEDKFDLLSNEAFVDEYIISKIYSHLWLSDAFPENAVTHMTHDIYAFLKTTAQGWKGGGFWKPWIKVNCCCDHYGWNHNYHAALKAPLNSVFGVTVETTMQKR